MAGKCEPETLTERIRVNDEPTQASLTAAGDLRWSSGDGRDRCLSLELESEVLGYEAEGSVIRVKAFVKAASGGGRRRRRKDFVLKMPTEESAVWWSDHLGACIASLGRPKRLFVLVNPYGGNKCARKVFLDEVKPLLEDAGVLYTWQETKRQLHAQELASSLDLRKYDGIMCVSGDGVLAEVVNGLLKREDWESAIKVPLGIIPAGTGNGIAKSLALSVGDVSTVSTATFDIIRGHKRPLDVATVSQGDTKFFSVLLLAWGLISDIDIESEKYRWMGGARLDFYSVLRVLKLRKYHGHVQYVPAPGYEDYGETIRKIDGSNSEIAIPKQQGEDLKIHRFGYQGSGTQLEGLEWRYLDGPFILVWLINVPATSGNVTPAPEAQFSDGYMVMVIVRDCPIPTLLKLLFKMSDGSYRKSPYVTYLKEYATAAAWSEYSRVSLREISSYPFVIKIKVKAFRLEPGQQVGNPNRGGIIDCDGEVIARGEGTYKCHQQTVMTYGPPIQVTVEKGLATLFSPV